MSRLLVAGSASHPSLCPCCPISQGVQDAVGQAAIQGAEGFRRTGTRGVHFSNFIHRPLRCWKSAPCSRHRVRDGLTFVPFLRTLSEETPRAAPSGSVSATISRRWRIPAASGKETRQVFYDEQPKTIEQSPDASLRRRLPLSRQPVHGLRFMPRPTPHIRTP